MRRVTVATALWGLCLGFAGTPAGAQENVGVVSHVQVLSDRVKDVSSLEAWKKSYIRDDMTDKDKALAIWETLVAHQYQDTPPCEFLNNENTVQDAIKMFNVYGYSFCGVAANEIASLARYLGLKCRISTIVAHVLPEIEWNGQWHMLDASLINFFVFKDQPADAVNGRFSKALTHYAVPNGKIASIEEIQAAIKEWYDRNPDYLDKPKEDKGKPKGNDAKLRKFHAEGGWLGWKNGPRLLANCPFYGGDGWLPARTHGWYSTMQEYDGSTYFPYEAGYSMGYHVNVRLRPGEKLIRNWSNKGLFVNMDGTGGVPGSLKATIGRGNWAYCTKFGDLAPGRVGNGELIYNVPLDVSLERTAWRFENLSLEAGTLRAKDDTKQGILEIRNPCSYVYLRGEMTLDATVAQGGSVRVFFSENNGLDWTEVGKIEKSGERKIDLSKRILRRYDYRVRILLKGKGTSLAALGFRHDIQHSQRPLPALVRGKNTITFSTGPPEGTVTIEGASDVRNKGKQLIYTDFHPGTRNIKGPMLLIDPAKKDGEVSYAITTPGDMTKMTIMTHYRARDRRAGWDVEVSYDGGKTFKRVARCPGGTPFFGVFTEVTDIPPGTTSAVVKWIGTTFWNATMIFNHRIDAYYTEPFGGFRPVKVTYLWEEGGIEKKDEHVARAAKEVYTITCESTPQMKSLIVELAD